MTAFKNEIELMEVFCKKVVQIKFVKLTGKVEFYFTVVTKPGLTILLIQDLHHKCFLVSFTTNFKRLFYRTLVSGCSSGFPVWKELLKVSNL